MLTVATDKMIAAILALLPEDGTPVANRIMRAMLAKRLETRVVPEEYFAAIAKLAQSGAVGRARGRGGSIFLASTEESEPPQPEKSDPAGAWSEAQLMAPTKRYLEQVFGPSLDLPQGSTCLVSDTSNNGPRDGQWARPDFVLVSVMHFQLVPGSQLDVHTFELKNEAGGSMQAVHEALAQTRFSNFGHLIWYVPHRSKVEAKLPEIETHCAMHGLGLIIIRDPNNLDSWEVRLDPVAKATASATIDAFLLARLPPVHRERIREAVFGVRA